MLKAFTDGQVGEIYLAYTHFKNTVTQEAKLIKLLPVELDENGADEKEDSNILMNFEPESGGGFGAYYSKICDKPVLRSTGGVICQ